MESDINVGKKAMEVISTHEQSDGDRGGLQFTEAEKPDSGSTKDWAIYE